MKPREVKRRLEADGWVELPGGKTSHRNYKHPHTKVKEATILAEWLIHRHSAFRTEQ